MDEAALHDLLSGRRRDLGAKLLRSGLTVASWCYSFVMDQRNRAYDRGRLPIHRVDVPVISLGNITTGGTGKTPFAAWLTNWLIAAGRKPGLISRGYRSLNHGSSDQPAATIGAADQGNDEKRVLDRLCPGVPHLQQRDRVASARRAVSEFGCDVLVLDDGFQHRRLHRDLDLALVDALQPWGYGRLLPRGLLREPIRSLHRATFAVLTRADQVSKTERESFCDQFTEICGHEDCIQVAFKPSRLVDLNWNPFDLATIKGQRAFAFCGIGNPTGFRQTVESIGVDCHTVQPFPDHHHYNQQDLINLSRQASELNAEVVLTTQKDLVKIPATAWSGPPLFAIEIGVDFLSGRELLEFWINRMLKNFTEGKRT